MAKKRVPTDRENAKSIARWEGEGGARKSPSAEERDSRETQVTAERRRTRQMRPTSSKVASVAQQPRASGVWAELSTRIVCCLSADRCTLGMSAMSRGTMIAPNATVSRTWFAQAWEVASDLVLATALIWTLPLLLGIVAAIVRLLLKAM